MITVSKDPRTAKLAKAVVAPETFGADILTDGGLITS